MAALFSPPVLRYAVPALALTAVIAISFLALRQQRRPDLVAQKEPLYSAAPAFQKGQQNESPVAQSNTEGSAKIRSGTESRAAVDSSRDRKSFQDSRSGVAQAPAETPGADVLTGSPLKDSAQSKQGYAARSRPVFAPEPQAAPPPPKPALSEADKTGPFQKKHWPSAKSKNFRERKRRISRVMKRDGMGLREAIRP